VHRRSATSRRRAGVADAALPLGSDPNDALAAKRRLLAEMCKVLGGQSTAGANSAASDAHADAEVASLPPRLHQTLQSLLAGDSEKQIARRLAISPHTVHVYVKSLYRKFGVCSRGELLARWVRAAPPRAPSKRPASGTSPEPRRLASESTLPH